MLMMMKVEVEVEVVMIVHNMLEEGNFQEGLAAHKPCTWESIEKIRPCESFSARVCVKAEFERVGNSRGNAPVWEEEIELEQRY